MSNLISEIRSSYEKKIAALQQEIEHLRSKMTIVLSALEEDIGELEVVAPKEKNILLPVAKRAQTKTDGGPTTRIRLIQAIDRMPLSFGTNELLRAVNNDGTEKQVSKNRALKIFRDLITEGIVKTEKPHSGKRGGIYTKVIKGTQDETTTLGQDLALVGGKGGDGHAK